MPDRPEAPSLLTVAEYQEIEPIESGRSELVDGRVLRSPSSLGRHSRAIIGLAVALCRQLPPSTEVLSETDVDLGLAPSADPGTVLRPDLIVVDPEVVSRQDVGGGLITADNVVIAIEVVSSSSSRADHVYKRGDYADAGIPYYWIVDLTPPVSLLSFHLTDTFGYVENSTATGTFTTTEPFPVTIDLDALRQPARL